MPSTSKKQHNFMAAVSANPKFAKKVGVPQTVGAEFIKADKGKKFLRGGEMAESKKMMAKGLEFMKKGAPKKPAASPYGSPTAQQLKNRGNAGLQDKMKANQDRARSQLKSAITGLGAAATSNPGMKKGGKVKKMAAGGLAAGHKSADGIASKGKTKAKQVAMKRGGMCGK